MNFEYQNLGSGDFELPSQWRVTNINDVSKINELTIKKGDAPFIIEYIDIASVDKGTILELQRISFDKSPSRARRIVRNNDTLISTVRPNLEHYAFIKTTKTNTIASTGFAVITAKHIHPRYLYYYVTTKPFTEYLSRIAESHTSAYPAINPDVIENAEILVPPLPEQKAIAHILGTLDDKIELNQQMNQTLEAIAKAIFKSWFVDFDPVRAKMEGRQPVGMDAATAELFPDSFEESASGLIPKGWRVGVFSDLVNILSGGTPKTSISEYWDGNIKWFSVKDAPNPSDVFVIDTEKRITQLGVEKSAAQILPEGVTIITARGTVGKLALIGSEMAINQSCFGIQGQQENTDYFTYFNLYSVISELQYKSHGSVFDTINRQTFQVIHSIIAPSKLRQEFDNKIDSIMKEIKHNLYESRTLTTIRDTLLPKLMSGEIRVKEAEKLLDAVV